MMTSTEIRQQFFDFFISKGHVIVPSAPIVVKNDPTLMFTNAGMNQFKDYFLGNKQAVHKRVADTQKCLRVSGKHNDLEEVGVDTYHHTMFEMLGNWSFGDYFKKEAIAWSWELLTEVYKIPKDRLYVTVFGGDESEKLPKDDEALHEWKKWLAEDRVLLFGRKDNFWEMGDTGPCGPCTEIHVDCRSDEERKKIDGKKLVNADNPQVIEIWNNVFIQFNRLKDGSLESLPEKHVDTGMGLERLVRVLQNKTSNYDTDIFTGTIEATEKLTAKKYEHTGRKQDVAFRVIADHIRAIGFTIADGQLPSNTGAGYVIRRILRRAVRYYFSYLHYKQPLLWQLMPLLAHQFENVFPELQKQIDFISKAVKEEEEAFLRTLDKGINRFEAFIDGSKIENYSLEITSAINHKRNKKIIHGLFAFELFDTYGFPLDLTILMANEFGWTVDVYDFYEALEKQKERSRSATMIDADDWVILDDQDVVISSVSLTDELGREIPGQLSNIHIVKYRRVRQRDSEYYQLVLNATDFYAEGGGQVGDSGVLFYGGKDAIQIFDTKKENDTTLHFTRTIPHDLNSQTSITPRYDIKRRKKIAIHHSATHLLHAALREVLGTHVTQKGSLVNEEHLRFDFSHFQAVSQNELKEIELIVNQKIWENIEVVIKQMPKQDAFKIGAMALFGEKYSDVVRVVIIDPKFSIELCGGSHVKNTGEIGFFMITMETSAGAGVRRIEAKAQSAAFEYLHEDVIVPIEEIKNIIKKKSKDTPIAIQNVIHENTELKKKIEKLEVGQLENIKKELLQKVVKINGANFIGETIEVGNADALKKLCFDLRNDLNNYVVVLASNIDGKAHVAVLLDEKLAAAKNLEAPRIIKEQIAPLIKGGGGGQKTLATAGGQDASNLKLVIEKVRSLL